MVKRIKKMVHSGITRDDAEKAFAEFAQADAKIRSIGAKMDMEMMKIREKYADQLAELEDIKEKNIDIVQTYATENRDSLFGKRKSVECVHGVFGFRTGTPKLKTLKGFTWGAVLKLCEEFLPGYIRTTNEVAKDKLLADRDREGVKELFAKVGVQVTQDETFFIEPKMEDESR